MEEVSLVNYTVNSFHVSYERFSHVLPLGWTSSLLHNPINCILCLEENSPLLLFTGVNELRTEVTLSPTMLFTPFWDGLAPPPSDSSTVLWRCLLGFCTHPDEFLSSFNSGSSSRSSCFCICIPNKQEIVFICMQMCLSPRLRFWIKSFTIPLIPNYTRALTWASSVGRRGGICLPIQTHLCQLGLFRFAICDTE